MTTPEGAFELPPPPPDRTAGVRVFFLVLALVVGAGAWVSGMPVLLLAGIVPMGMVYLLVVSRRQEIGGALAMSALDRAARGRYDEARALLDAVPRNVLGSYVGMMVDNQRAALALYEGKLETAVAEATKGARMGKTVGAVASIHRQSALSLRAVALAGLGRKEEALADVAAVRGADYRQASFLARAALAEAVLFARDKDLDGLARLLREERALLLGATGPRERMIVRALSRMVAAKKVSVYREPAPKGEQEMDEHASWIAQLAPEAASYAASPKLGARLDAPAAVDPKAVADAAKATKAKRPWGRVAALWAILMIMIFVIWSLLRSDDVQVGPPVGAPVEGLNAGGAAFAFSFLVFGFTAAIIALRLARGRKLTRELSQAFELRMRGKHDEARAALTKLAASKTVLVKPQAERELAVIATSAGDFKAARHHAEAGIAATSASPAALTLSRPVLLPQLHAELAFALAAAGRARKAEEALGRIATISPAYPYLARDTFRVRLVSLVKAGQLNAAAAMARERPVDLPLTMQEELLCDALRVYAGDELPEGERVRIELDLREDAVSARFLDGVAPPLRRMLHPSAGPRIADPVLAAPPMDLDDDEDEQEEPKRMQHGR